MQRQFLKGSTAKHDHNVQLCVSLITAIECLKRTIASAARRTRNSSNVLNELR